MSYRKGLGSGGGLGVRSFVEHVVEHLDQGISLQTLCDQSTEDKCI